MTIAVDLLGARKKAGRDESCAAEARRLVVSEPLDEDGQAKLWAKALEPLRKGATGQASIEQLLINLQLVRYPSAVQPSLGGHAEYLMLSFKPDDAGELLPSTLENMPDLARLKSSSALRADLVSWVGAHLDAIDRGVAILPERFLATEAISVTPRGLSRRANRPFKSLLSGDDFAELSFSELERVKSPAALVRRLDDLSCVGCHQARTIAGFHWLGVDGPEAVIGNALFVPRSVPLLADGRRRNHLVRKLARGSAIRESRPFAERADEDEGIIGSRCGLGDPGFADWSCEDGLVCSPLDAPVGDREVGVCVSEGPRRVGEACEVGPVRSARRPGRDRVVGAQRRACAEGVCNTNRVGFPAGMCTATCASSEDDVECGVIALLTPFNNCLARKTPFTSCLRDHVAPAGLRSCDADNPCRDDYVCSRSPEGKGACIPPYFLFQLRVDGHP